MSPGEICLYFNSNKRKMHVYTNVQVARSVIFKSVIWKVPEVTKTPEGSRRG